MWATSVPPARVKPILHDFASSRMLPGHGGKSTLLASRHKKALTGWLSQKLQLPSTVDLPSQVSDRTERPMFERSQ